MLINGGVNGTSSFIGSGAVLREGLNLPPKTVISAGKRVMDGLCVRRNDMNKTLVIAEAGGTIMVILILLFLIEAAEAGADGEVSEFSGSRACYKASR